MATVSRVFTINRVAKMLGEDPELLQAIIANDDNLTYGAIVTVWDDADEPVDAR